jgi:hypothetical protein
VGDLIKQLPLLSEVHLTDCGGQDQLATTYFPGISLYTKTG